MELPEWMDHKDRLERPDCLEVLVTKAREDLQEAPASRATRVRSASKVARAPRETRVRLATSAPLELQAPVVSRESQSPEQPERRAPPDQLDPSDPRGHWDLRDPLDPRVLKGNKDSRAR